MKIALCTLILLCSFAFAGMAMATGFIPSIGASLLCALAAMALGASE